MSDTELLNFMERYWRERDDCPVGFCEDSFYGNESGTYPRNMTLREAIRAVAAKVEEADDV